MVESMDAQSYDVASHAPGLVWYAFENFRCVFLCYISCSIAGRGTFQFLAERRPAWVTGLVNMIEGAFLCKICESNDENRIQRCLDSNDGFQIFNAKLAEAVRHLGTLVAMPNLYVT